jgi:RNA polymerase sigma-70 factor (ECF subfamily)
MDIAAQQASLDQARAGDNKALGALLQSLRAYVRVLVHAVRGPHAADAGDDSDLIQDALVEAVRCFPSFRGTTLAELRSWLRIVAVRTARRALRGGHSLDPLDEARALVDPHSGPSTDVVRQEIAARVAQSLTELPEEMQRVLICRFVDGLDHAAIGHLLGKSSGAVRKLFVRALERFREVYRE